MRNEKKGAKHNKPRVKKVKEQKNGFFAKLKAGFLSMSMTKRVVIISLICVILALIIAIGTVLGVYLDFKKQYKDRNEVITDPEILEIQPINEKIINIALFGIDSRSQNYSGNSDSIMILSVNTETGDIKLISVMRDSLVEMVDKDGKSYKPNKINSAYARGGASYAIKVLNKNFGLDIKRSITVNFFGMAEIIDAVGGIEINVLEREINVKNGLNANIKEQASKLGIENPPLVEKEGKQLLTGIQAVAWARIRSVSTEQGTANDYGRTDRQRVVMEQLLNKVLSMDMSLGEFRKFAKTLLGYMQIHNMEFEEAVSIAFKVLSKKGEFDQTRVPQAKYVINDNFLLKHAGSTVYYDLSYASKLIHAMIYDDVTSDDYINTNGVEKNKWYDGQTSSSGSGNSNNSDDDEEETTSSNGSSSSNTSSTDTPSTDTPSTDTPSEDSSEDSDSVGDGSETTSSDSPTTSESEPSGSVDDGDQDDSSDGNQLSSDLTGGI